MSCLDDGYRGAISILVCPDDLILVAVRIHTKGVERMGKECEMWEAGLRHQRDDRGALGTLAVEPIFDEEFPTRREAAARARQLAGDASWDEGCLFTPVVRRVARNGRRGG